MSSEQTPPVGADVLGSAAAGPLAARGGALRAAGYAGGTLLTVVSVPLMIRHLGIEDFGRYVTVLTLVTIVVGLTEGGLATIALREYAARDGADRDRVMSELLGLRIALALVAALVAVGFAVVAGYPAVQVTGTAAVGVALVAWTIQTMLAAPLQGELRFGWVTAIELLRQVLLVAGIVALVVAGASLGPFFFAMLPASVVALVVTAMLVRGLAPLRPTLHPRRSWPLLRDTLTYAAAIALNVVYFRIAVVALSLMVTATETGYFATAFRVMEVLVAVPLLLIGAAFPILARAARDDRGRLDSATSRLVEIALVMGVWLALGIALAAEPIVFVLADDAAGPSVGLLRLLAVALVASFVTVACGYALLSLRRHRVILIANAAALATSVVLTLALIPPYGATGAAVAVLAAESVLMTWVFVALVQARPLLGAALRRAPAVLAAGAIACAVVLVPGVPPLADAAVAVLAYPALLLAVRRFPPEIRHALHGNDEAAAVAR